jgi:hypothetical protein
MEGFNMNLDYVLEKLNDEVKLQQATLNSIMVDIDLMEYSNASEKYKQKNINRWYAEKQLVVDRLYQLNEAIDLIKRHQYSEVI